MTDRFLRLPEVMEKVSMSKPTIYRMIKRGTFPPGHLIEGTKRSWRESEIDQWMDEVAPREAG